VLKCFLNSLILEVNYSRDPYFLLNLSVFVDKSNVNFIVNNFFKFINVVLLDIYENIVRYMYMYSVFVLE